MDVVVLGLALAVEGEGAQLFGQRIVIGEHRAAVAIAAERLGRVEAGRRDMAERRRTCVSPADPPIACAASSMTSRFSRSAIAHDGVVVGGKAEQVDRNDRLGLQAAFGLDHGDRRFEAVDVDVVAVGVDVDEHRLGLRQRHDFGGGGEGEARHEDGVARADAGSIERQQQRVGAVGAGDAVLDADIGREAGFRTPRPAARGCSGRPRRRGRWLP